MATVIVFANQKGGVGKTTLDSDVSAGLALRGFKVLMIDTDPQATLTENFGISTEDDKRLIVGDLLSKRDNVRFEDVVVKTQFENLWLLPSNINLEEARFRMESDPADGPRYLEQLITKIRHMFDVILIDACPSFSILFLNSLIAADSVIIPVALQKPSLASLKKIQKTITNVQQKIKPIQILGVVGTFYRKGENEPEGCLKLLRESLGGNMFDSLIRYTPHLAESFWENKPIQHHRKDSIGYQDMEALTEEVIRRAGLIKKEPAAAL